MIDDLFFSFQVCIGKDQIFSTFIFQRVLVVVWSRVILYFLIFLCWTNKRYYVPRAQLILFLSVQYYVICDTILSNYCWLILLCTYTFVLYLDSKSFIDIWTHQQHKMKDAIFAYFIIIIIICIYYVIP